MYGKSSNHGYYCFYWQVHCLCHVLAISKVAGTELNAVGAD